MNITEMLLQAGMKMNSDLETPVRDSSDYSVSDMFYEENNDLLKPERVSCEILESYVSEIETEANNLADRLNSIQADIAALENAINPESDDLRPSIVLMSLKMQLNGLKAYADVLNHIEHLCA